MAIQKRTRIIFAHHKTLASASNADSTHQTRTLHRNFAFIQKKGKTNDVFLDIPRLASRVLCEFEKKKNGRRF